MRHSHTDSEGSFIAWGTGFSYHYNARNHTIDVEDLTHVQNYAHIKLASAETANALTYISTLDKTNQIKALMYSNNGSIDLTETLSPDRISAILANTSKITSFINDLRCERFDQFAEAFCQEYNLKSLKLKRYMAKHNSDEFFIGRIHTQNNNAVCARGCSLVTLMSSMSDRTLRDLITMEFGNRYDYTAQNLLNASSKFATISRVMDEFFIPAKRLKPARNTSEHNKISHKK